MADEKKRAIVLLSGGMDSCVCAALAARDYQAAAVHVSYGQRTEERERKAFLGICDRLEIRDRLVVRNEALRAIGGSALTDANIAVPESHALGREIPVTYVPFRNAHFLAVAVGPRFWEPERSTSARLSRIVRAIPIVVRPTMTLLTRSFSRVRRKGISKLLRPSLRCVNMRL